MNFPCFACFMMIHYPHKQGRGVRMNDGIQEDFLHKEEKYTWDDLQFIMKTLLGPGGCPWDKEQTHESLRRYLLEECYEVIDAIDEKNMPSLKDELGDVLFQVVFHSEIARETGEFQIEDVVDNLCRKMIRRHPHVFGDARTTDTDGVWANWEAIKAREKQEGINGAKPTSVISVSSHLPAVLYAQKIQEKASRVGFDWKDREEVWQQLDSELIELKEAATAEEQQEELGDALFTVINLARFYGVDSESALRGSAQKFLTRFAYIEKKLQAEKKEWQDCNMDLLNEFWTEAKKQENICK